MTFYSSQIVVVLLIEQKGKEKENLESSSSMAILQTNDNRMTWKELWIIDFNCGFHIFSANNDNNRWREREKKGKMALRSMGYQ